MSMFVLFSWPTVTVGIRDPSGSGDPSALSGFACRFRTEPTLALPGGASRLWCPWPVPRSGPGGPGPAPGQRAALRPHRGKVERRGGTDLRQALHPSRSGGALRSPGRLDGGLRFPRENACLTGAGHIWILEMEFDVAVRSLLRVAWYLSTNTKQGECEIQIGSRRALDDNCLRKDDPVLAQREIARPRRRHFNVPLGLVMAPKRDPRL